MLRFCLAALRLYPDAWRERYEPEVRAVLEQSSVSAATLFDLLQGALDAHLHPAFAASGVRRMRGSVLMALYCWIAFVLVGASFAKATEDAPFRAAEGAHGLLGGAHIAVIVLAMAAAVIVVVAGAPIALRVLVQAYRGDQVLRRALLMLGCAVGAFALATAGVSVLAQHLHGNGGLAGHAGLLGWIALTVVVAVVCGWSARRAVCAARLEWIELAAGSAGAWLLARLMLALTAAVVLYTIALATDAPGVAALSNGPLRFGTTLVLVGQAVAMALISALALLSARRGRLRLAR